MRITQQLDAALEAVRAIGHRNDLNPKTVQLLEHAGAMLREAWLVEDGQMARNPEEVFTVVSRFFRMMEPLAARAEKE